MRHGDAGFSAGISDSDRGLSHEGKSEIAQSAAALLQTGLKPSLLISSPVKRAKETAKLLTTIFEPHGLVPEQAESMAWHYNSHPGAATLDLLAYNQEVTLVVSHQPLIGDLIWHWCRERVSVSTGSIHIIDYQSDQNKISGQILKTDSGRVLH